MFVSPKIANRGKWGDATAGESTILFSLARVRMEILTALVLRFDVPPQLIIASAILFLAYLALLGSLLTFRSIAHGLYASAQRVRA